MGIEAIDTSPLCFPQKLNSIHLSDERLTSVGYSANSGILCLDT